MRCLPAADGALLRRPGAAHEDWWCPRCRRLTRLAFFISRELAHPELGSPEAAVEDVARRLYTFMSDAQHELHWDPLRDAGMAMVNVMPYTLPWMLGDDATVAASVDAHREEAIAAQAAALPVPERVAPGWWVGDFADANSSLDQHPGDGLLIRGGGDTVIDGCAMPTHRRSTLECSPQEIDAPCHHRSELAAFAPSSTTRLPTGFAFRPTSTTRTEQPLPPVAMKWMKAEDTAGGPVRTSKFRGVSRRYGKWKARIKQNGHDLVIGDFDDELQAACAYDAKARQLHGEKAMLNFPPPSISPSVDDAPVRG